MGLKSTIYKLEIVLSDMDRNYYDTLNLVVVQHPSETLERVSARILAFCINVQERLEFTKGLGDIESPDILVRELDQQLSLWIDVGEPSFDRIKKASHSAQEVKVYTFNSKSKIWWKKNKEKFCELPVSVFQFTLENIQSLSSLLERTMQFSVSISDNSAYIATDSGECEVSWFELTKN
jgi:uncharacterized protein YaeQ